MGREQTMHKDKSSELSRQTENKFNYRKTCMITLGTEPKFPFDGCTMDKCTMNNKIILCRLSSLHAEMAPSHVNLTPKTPRAGLA